MAEIEQFLSKDAEKQIKDLVKLMADLAKSYEKAFKSSVKLDEQIKKTSKSQEKNNEKKKKLTEIQKEEARILKASLTTKAKLEVIKKGGLTLLAKEQELLKKKNRELRDEAKAVLNSKNAYDKLSKELNDTRKAYKNLAAAGNENTKAGKAQLAQIRRLDSQLKRIDNSVGQNQRSVGKYSDAIKGMTARFLGWGAAIAIASRALMSGFRAVRDNSKANAELRGILNKTRKETVALREEQLRLGSATVFTATQVTKAQTELSRLGLSMEQIIELTPAILDGAIALGVDMADAATLVAGQLNAFGLSAKDGKRVTDVLVRSTQISAFNFIKLKDALRVVSPAAAAVGDSIEDTVSKLTAAVDANIDAGTASTALRNIYIELAKSGQSWNDAMTEINTSTNKLSTANDLFGKRGAVVALALAGNTEKINENKIALDAAAGSAEAFAKAQRDNLAGDQLLWTSAWEGFFQQLNEGNSLISEFTRGTIQAFTAAMGALTRTMADTDLETILWEENLIKADLSLESLGRIANKTADEISKLKKIIGTSEDEARLRKATSGLVEVEKQRAFILDLIKKKIKELNPVVVEKTETTDEDTEAIDENTEANEKALIVLRKLKRLTAELPAEFSEFQLGLLAITDRLFGKNTIDADAEEFLAKTGDTIKKVGEIASEARKKELDAQKLAAEKAADIESRKQEERQKLAASSLEVINDIAQRFADNKIQQLSDESNAIELQRQTQLENAEGDKAKEAQINDTFDRKQAVIKQKQWKADQDAAITQITIQGLVGAAKTIGNLGFPAAIPFLFAQAALALGQIELVKAQKPPKFAKGSKGLTEDTFAEVGEAGRELLFMPGGGVAMAEQSTKAVLPKGTVIKTNKETEQILAANQLKASRESDLASRDYSELRMLGNAIAEDRKSILKAVSDQDKYLFEVSKQGIINMSKRNKSGVTTYLNNRFP